MCGIAEAAARACGLGLECRGGYAVLIRGDAIEAYIFPREDNPRLGIYGYYGGHFVEVWEKDKLYDGIREVVYRDPVLRCISKALLGLGEAIVRVIRLRGKYGDPHVSLSFETGRTQVIREYIVLDGEYVPRIRPGEYAWRREEKCGEGVYGLLDGVPVRFKEGRIGLVRGLTVYKDCGVLCGERLYGELGVFEETIVDGLICKKIPYSVAADLSLRDETSCCGYMVKVSLRGWETPLWRRVADRYEVIVLKLLVLKNK